MSLLHRWRCQAVSIICHYEVSGPKTWPCTKDWRRENQSWPYWRRSHGHAIQLEYPVLQWSKRICKIKKKKFLVKFIFLSTRFCLTGRKKTRIFDQTVFKVEGTGYLPRKQWVVRWQTRKLYTCLNFLKLVKLIISLPADDLHWLHHVWNLWRAFDAGAESSGWMQELASIPWEIS